jgi:hypothetical protein
VPLQTTYDYLAYSLPGRFGLRIPSEHVDQHSYNVRSRYHAPNESTGFTGAQLQAKITTDRAFRSSMPYLPDSSLLVFEDIPYRLKSPNDISKRLKVGIYKGEEYKIKGPV